MAQSFDRQPEAPAWPNPTNYGVPSERHLLPIAGAHNFRYVRVFRLGEPEKPRVVAKKAPARSQRPAYGGWRGNWPASSRGSNAVGHQLTVVRPPINLAAPQTR
jgi:hypothetical protein